MATPPVTIDAGPPVPDSNDPESEFDPQYEAFLDWQKNELQPKANAQAQGVYDNTVIVEGAVDVATDAALAAVAAAASAINSPGTQGTSTTSMAMTVATKIFVTDAGKDWALGQPMAISRTSAPATQMFGPLLAYNKVTGDMSVGVDTVKGSGTYTDWTIALGMAAPSSNTPPSVTRDPRTSNTMLVAGDKGKWIDITAGTFTQTADTPGNLGPGWELEYGNSGSGVVTFGSLVIYQGQRYKLNSDGTTIRARPLADLGVMVVRDEKTSGAGPGNISGSWGTRTLNTVQSNTIAGASLASSQITLPAGTYQISASTPALNSQQFKARLYNVTTSAVLIVGTSEKPFGNSIHPVTRSFVNGCITLTGTTVIRLEDISGSGTTAGGEPSSIASTVEVYSEITIRKVA